MGIKEACPNYSKGGEAGWEFQVHDVTSVISIMQCSSAFSRGSPTSSRKNIKTISNPLFGFSGPAFRFDRDLVCEIPT